MRKWRRFSQDEWALLGPAQKILDRDEMLENVRNLASVGKGGLIPSFFHFFMQQIVYHISCTRICEKNGYTWET